MPKTLFALMILIVTAMAQAFARFNQEANLASGTRVSRILANQMKIRGIPGLQFAIVRHGKVVQTGQLGLANIEDQVKVDGKTAFCINSITKAFTGVAVYQLVEQGKIELKAPIDRYLNNLPKEWGKVRIVDLLTHQSGLPDLINEDAELIVAGNELASWKKVQSLPLLASTGERFQYNGLNYLLLGKIIEGFGGSSFQEFIRKFQFEPAKMNRTIQAGFADNRDVIRHSARGYSYMRKVNGQFVGLNSLSVVHEEFPPSLQTAAGLYSTAEELANWLVELQSGKLGVSKTGLKKLWEPGRLKTGQTAGFSQMLNGYSLGWPVVSRPKHPAIMAIGGGRSVVAIYPEDDLAVIVLTNLQRSSPESFVDEIAGAYVDDLSSRRGFEMSSSIQMLSRRLQEPDFSDLRKAYVNLQAENLSFKLTEKELNEWGMALLLKGELDLAIRVMKFGVGTFPSSVASLETLAYGFEVIDSPKFALDAYRAILKLDPNHKTASQRAKELQKR